MPSAVWVSWVVSAWKAPLRHDCDESHPTWVDRLLIRPAADDQAGTSNPTDRSPRGHPPQRRGTALRRVTPGHWPQSSPVTRTDAHHTHSLAGDAMERSQQREGIGAWATTGWLRCLRPSLTRVNFGLAAWRATPWTGLSMLGRWRGTLVLTAPRRWHRSSLVGVNIGLGA